MATDQSMRAHNQVLLTLQGIGWITAQIEHVREQLHMSVSPHWMGDLDDAPPTTQEIANRHENFLKLIADDLRGIMERTGDYLNGQDMASPTDIVVTTPLFDLLHQVDEV